MDSIRFGLAVKDSDELCDLLSEDSASWTPECLAYKLVVREDFHARERYNAFICAQVKFAKGKNEDDK